jgi:dihydrofolate reductase
MIKMNLIVAMDQEGIIGDGKKMLWHIPDDLKRFKSLTLGQVVVMGRKTFDSLPFRDGLPSRLNIVLTKNPENYKNIENKLYFIRETELQSMMETKCQDKRIFIIGGGEIYRKFFDQCQTVYITMVYRKDAKLERDSILFDCEIKPGEFINIYRSGPYFIRDLEYEYFTYTRKILQSARLLDKN